MYCLKYVHTAPYLVSRASDDRRENGSGRVVAGESGLAHTGTVVHHQGRYVFVAHVDGYGT